MLKLESAITYEEINANSRVDRLKGWKKWWLQKDGLWKHRLISWLSAGQDNNYIQPKLLDRYKPQSFWKCDRGIGVKPKLDVVWSYYSVPSYIKQLVDCCATETPTSKNHLDRKSSLGWRLHMFGICPSTETKNECNFDNFERLPIEWTSTFQLERDTAFIQHWSKTVVFVYEK